MNFSISRGAMQNSIDRIAMIAQRVAGGIEKSDLVQDIPDLMKNEKNFQANLLVLKTQHEILGWLLDIKV